MPNHTIASQLHPAACVAQVAPLFAIHGLPKTPEDGESFLGGPGNEMTRSELQVRWFRHLVCECYGCCQSFLGGQQDDPLRAAGGLVVHVLETYLLPFCVLLVTQ